MRNVVAASLSRFFSMYCLHSIKPINPSRLFVLFLFRFHPFIVVVVVIYKMIVVIVDNHSQVGMAQTLKGREKFFKFLSMPQDFNIIPRNRGQPLSALFKLIVATLLLFCLKY